jgi:uncharacterized protein (DUF4213/DUF364 family)
MKNLLNYLVGELGSELYNVTVEDARIGLVYTGVLLSSGHAGVAYTPLYELSECPVLASSDNIAGKSALKLVKMILSSNFVEVAVGVATANALSQIVFEENPEKYVFSNADVLDLIQAEDKVAMVGYFAPLVPKVVQKARELYVLEKRKVEDNRVKVVSPSEISEVLSLSNVVLIIGSTLVNKTINEILKHITNAREIVLLGPTASMTPQPFFEKGVTAVMGIRITDPTKMLKIVSEAGGTQQLLISCAKKTAFMKGST